jgi:hypothetical protein
VADHADRLAGSEDVANEADRPVALAQLVGIRHTTRQDERVVVGRVRVIENPVDRLVKVLEGLDLATLGRDQLGFSSRLLNRRARLGQLDLFNTLLRDEERDLAAVSSPAIATSGSIARCVGATTGPVAANEAAPSSVERRCADHAGRSEGRSGERQRESRPHRRQRER